VAPGEVFALLGPNGAGKTTTVEILEGLRPRDAGRVEVLGEPEADADLAELLTTPAHANTPHLCAEPVTPAPHREPSLPRHRASGIARHMPPTLGRGQGGSSHDLLGDPVTRPVALNPPP
jgi:energy-coupling factor transporter ATP-binding protein EcfA2